MQCFRSPMGLAHYAAPPGPIGIGPSFWALGCCTPTRHRVVRRVLLLLGTSAVAPVGNFIPKDNDHMDPEDQNLRYWLGILDRLAFASLRHLPDSPPLGVANGGGRRLLLLLRDEMSDEEFAVEWREIEPPPRLIDELHPIRPGIRLEHPGDPVHGLSKRALHLHLRLRVRFTARKNW